MPSGRVSIIVLNMNGKDLLKDCLRSIIENTVYTDFEVVVVDNGSTDGSIQMVKNNFDSISVIENGYNVGFSIANNKGIIQSADSDFYVLLNNDIKAKEGWLSEMVKAASDSDVGIVGSKLLYPDQTIQHAGAGIGFTGFYHIGVGEDPDDYNQNQEVEYVTGACMLIKDCVIDDIGYLDEMYSPIYAEEVDYCQRAIESGFKIVFAADSELIHYESKTTEEATMLKKFYLKKNDIKYRFMNESGLKLFIGLLIDFILIIYWGVIGEWWILRKTVSETAKDLEEMIRKRWSRTNHIPSYYCEGIRDFSKRYQE